MECIAVMRSTKIHKCSLGIHMNMSPMFSEKSSANRKILVNHFVPQLACELKEKVTMKFTFICSRLSNCLYTLLQQL